MCKDTVNISIDRFKELERHERMLEDLKNDPQLIIVQESNIWGNCPTTYLSTDSKELEKLSRNLKSKNESVRHWKGKYIKISERSLIKRIFNYG